MAKRKLNFIIMLVIGFCLFACVLKFMPISISFGEQNKPNPRLKNDILWPGFYGIYIKKPMRLPEEMELIAAQDRYVECGTTHYGMIGAGFYHEGKRKDDDKKNCGGPIKTLLQDDRSMKYECLLCGKTWIIDPNELQ